MTDLLLAEACFCHETIGTPEDVVAAIKALLPSPARVLWINLAPLAPSMWNWPRPRLHVDAVSLRMLCTYADRGTDWQDRNATIRRILIDKACFFYLL